MRIKDQEFGDKLFKVIVYGNNYGVKGYSGKIWVTGSKSTCYRWLKSIYCQFTAESEEKESRESYRAEYDENGFRLPYSFPEWFAK